MIAGANGQLGKCLQGALAYIEHEWLAVGRSDLDITRASDVEQVVASAKPDVIINAAAYTAVDKAEAEPDHAFNANSHAVANLVEAADTVGALLIHVSTDYVFDGRSKRPYLETDTVNPMGVYG